MSQMNREQRRARIKANRATVSTLPDQLQIVPRSEWGSNPPPKLTQVWRSRQYLVQIYEEGVRLRLSINRTTLNQSGQRWEEDLSWEELQAIKSQVGFSDCDAVEIYPRDCDVVNVANMRHLWILPQPLTFAWRKSA